MTLTECDGCACIVDFGLPPAMPRYPVTGDVIYDVTRCPKTEDVEVDEHKEENTTAKKAKDTD